MISLYAFFQQIGELPKSANFSSHEILTNSAIRKIRLTLSRSVKLASFLASAEKKLPQHLSTYSLSLQIML